MSIWGAADAPHRETIETEYTEIPHDKVPDDEYNWAAGPPPAPRMTSRWRHNDNNPMRK